MAAAPFKVHSRHPETSLNASSGVASAVARGQQVATDIAMPGVSKSARMVRVTAGVFCAFGMMNGRSVLGERFLTNPLFQEDLFVAEAAVIELCWTFHCFKTFHETHVVRAKQNTEVSDRQILDKTNAFGVPVLGFYLRS